MDLETEAKCRAIFKKPAREWNRDDYVVLDPLIKKGERENLKRLRTQVQLED